MEHPSCILLQAVQGRADRDVREADGLGGPGPHAGAVRGRARIQVEIYKLIYFIFILIIIFHSGAAAGRSSRPPTSAPSSRSRPPSTGMSARHYLQGDSGGLTDGLG